MVIDIFLIFIAFISFLILVGIIISKFPLLTRIEIKKTPKEEQKKLKFFILERKITEKFKKINLRNSFRDQIEKIKERIFELENKYRQEKYEKILKKKPLELEQKIESLIQEGEKFLENKDYLKAEKVFLQASSLNPVNIKIFRNLAEIYFIQNKFSQAEKKLKYVLNLAWYSIKWWKKFNKNNENVPKDLIVELVNSLIDLGNFYRKTEKEERAFYYFKKALEFEPNNPKILDFLIEISIILNKIGEAKKYLIKLKEINPENQKIAIWEEKIKNLTLPT